MTSTHYYRSAFKNLLKLIARLTPVKGNPEIYIGYILNNVNYDNNNYNNNYNENNNNNNNNNNYNSNNNNNNNNYNNFTLINFAGKELKAIK